MKPVFLRKRYQHIDAPINKSTTALDVIPVHKTHYQAISVCECEQVKTYIQGVKTREAIENGPK